MTLTQYANPRQPDSDEVERLFERALLIRAVEERLLKLFSEGRLHGTVHTCIGQELAGISICATLREGDRVCSNHRGHGHFLSLTDDVDGLVAELMGRTTGVCGGRGGSQHLFGAGFLSNGIQGGMVPVAAGIAMAQKRCGEGAITVAFIGDGTLGEGVVYETFNIARLHRLPLLIVLENNRYAQSTSQSQTLAGSIRARGEAFGLRTATSSTWNLQELLGRASEMVEFVRESSLPALLEIETDRLMAHSKGDDGRERGELDRAWQRDLVTIFLRDNGEHGAKLKSQAELRVDDAVKAAESAPFTRGGGEDRAPSRSVLWRPVKPAVPERVVSRIYEALDEALCGDPRVLLLGEDIEAPYGGAFKVTRDLSDRYPGRVLNMPISEAAIVGLANGMALAGMKPVCELMFGDFLALAADQIINHAAKFQYMYNGRVQAPVIIRTPVGGRRGYGPTHSQSLEKLLFGVPGMLILALNHYTDPVDVYGSLLASIDRPTLILEHKLLYGAKLSDGALQGLSATATEDRFPAIRIRTATNAEITIFCYGGVLLEAEQAAIRLYEEEEIAVEIIAPTQVYPFDSMPVIESVRQTGRILIVEEGQSFAGLGSELLARLMEEAPAAARAVRRLGPPAHPIPCCGPLEKELLPSADHIVAAAVELWRASPGG